jgi:hypothetical protein
VSITYFNFLDALETFLKNAFKLVYNNTLKIYATKLCIQLQGVFCIKITLREGKGAMDRCQFGYLLCKAFVTKYIESDYREAKR